MLMHTAAGAGLLVLAGVQPVQQACTDLASLIMARPGATQYWTDEEQSRPDRLLYEVDGRRVVVRIIWRGDRPCFAGASVLKDGREQ